LRTLQHNSQKILPRLRLAPAVLGQLEQVLEDYLEYYLERKLNLKSVMRTLKGIR
jgi:hypothetical protein